jgi:hypothetical protein
MGKGRDKRKRKAKKQELKTKVQTMASLVRPLSDDLDAPLDPDAPVPVHIKPKPPTRAGAAKAIPEQDQLEDAAALTGTTNRFQ